MHFADGSDAGEATYAVVIRPGDEIIAGKNQRFRVLGSYRLRKRARRSSGCYRWRPRKVPVVLGAIHGLSVVLAVVCCVALVGWVADQTLRDVQKIRRIRRRT